MQKFFVLLTALALTAPAMAAERTIPDDMSFAMGLGATQNTGSLALNRAAAKVRIAGMNIEPYVQLGLSSATDKTTNTDTSTTTKSTTSGNELLVGARVAFPLASTPVAELQVLGDLSISRTASEVDPDGADNNVISSASSMGLDYGLGIEWYVSKHFSVAAQGTNDLFTYTSTSTEDQAANTKNETSGPSFGLIWNPTVALMFNLWF